MANGSLTDSAFLSCGSGLRFSSRFDLRKYFRSLFQITFRFHFRVSLRSQLAALFRPQLSEHLFLGLFQRLSNWSKISVTFSGTFLYQILSQTPYQRLRGWCPTHAGWRWAGEARPIGLAFGDVYGGTSKE